MRVVYKMVIIHQADTPKGSFVSVVAMGCDEEATETDTPDAYYLETGHRPSMLDLPIVTLATFRNLADLYPLGLLEKVEEVFAGELTVDRNYNLRRVAKITSWLPETWSEARIRESIGAYAIYET